MKKLSFSVLVFLSVSVFAQIFSQQGSRRVIEVKGRASDTAVVEVIYAIALVKEDPLFPAIVEEESDTINPVLILKDILSGLNLEAIEKEEDFEINPITEKENVFYVQVQDPHTLYLLVSRLRQHHPYFLGRIHKAEFANLSQLENRLKVEAVRNARITAEEMLAAAGARVTHVVSIQDRGVRRSGASFTDGLDWPRLDNNNPLEVVFTAEVVVTFAIR